MLNYSHNVPGAFAALADADDAAGEALARLKPSYEATQAALQSPLPTIKRLARRSMWPPSQIWQI